ncbi:PKD domain-containing protein, partial [bacterium]|nr:PKD domain-containing protein [bacterium]
AETSFKRYYQWMIDKNADEETLGLNACATDTVAYTVMVDTTGYQDMNFLVQGTITIHNPAPVQAVINSLEDLLDGEPVQLECPVQFPLIIAAADSFKCGYQKLLPNGEQRVNTATAVQQLFDYSYTGSPSPAETIPHQDTADVIFGTPSDEIDECVLVTDTNVDPTTLGTVCAADAPKTFMYDLVLGPYTSGGLHQVENTATYKTSDTETEGSDDWTISVTVTCASEIIPDFEANVVDGYSPMAVQFTDLSLNADGWLWDFGDGTTSTEQNPVHVFRNPPNKYYTVTLTVWDCCEKLSDTIVLENFIRVTRAAEAQFNAFPLVVAPDEEVQFTNLCGGGVNWFEWNFGDGQILKLRHNVSDKIHPTHAYADEGAHTVSLHAWGQGGDSTATVKDMIYVAANFVNMKFVEGSETLPFEPWINAVNHDIITTNANVVALNKEASAVFRLVDDASPILFDKVRILSNSGMGTRYANHLIKEFELWVSMDNVNYELAMNGSLTRHDMWKTFKFSPKAGKYIKLMIKSAQGDGSAYATLGEIQLFGTLPAALALLKDVEGLDIVDWKPVTEYQLGNAYPNPFNPSTTIQFALPTDAMVQLDVFNVRGQLVRTILNREVPTGRYSYRFNADGLSSGTYFYRFTAGKYQEIKRMTFLK